MEKTSMDLGGFYYAYKSSFVVLIIANLGAYLVCVPSEDTDP